jgi:hypothetical protein
MNFRDIIHNLDTILLCSVVLLLFVKGVLYATAANDQTPYNFFYNPRYAVHASNLKRVKKSKKLQNQLTVLLVSVISFLIVTLLFKLSL